mmetsp:Transcript_12277/g.29831  ORF Transcript_12277/g.29831 Transcript_12277/m.29831 type:complete len:249 (-) Transcript_12277:305-1051(-)
MDALFITLLVFLLLVHPVDGFAPVPSPRQRPALLLKEGASTEWFSYTPNGNAKDKTSTQNVESWIEEEFNQMGEMMAKKEKMTRSVTNKPLSTHDSVDWFAFVSQEKENSKDVTHDADHVPAFLGMGGPSSDWFGVASTLSPPKKQESLTTAPAAVTNTNEVDWFAVASELSDLNKPLVFLSDDHSAPTFLAHQFHPEDASQQVVHKQDSVDWFSTASAPKSVENEGSPTTLSTTNDADWFSFVSSCF